MTAMPHPTDAMSRLLRWLTPDWVKGHRDVLARTNATVRDSAGTVERSRDVVAQSTVYRERVARRLVGLDLGLQRHDDDPTP